MTASFDHPRRQHMLDLSLSLPVPGANKFPFFGLSQFEVGLSLLTTESKNKNENVSLILSLPLIAHLQMLSPHPCLAWE